MALSRTNCSPLSARDVTLGFMPLFPPRNPSPDHVKGEMYNKFQTWALRNYGDSGKTKTVTRRKYNRIVRILTGEEPATTENSKFRFWVKGKTFRLGPAMPSDGYRALFVPSKNTAGDDKGERSYKRVAIVEDFFNIIYNVHVEMDGRGGKHAGQKRTYRAIAETYSFLPREAVTRFLMSCSDCQKRMHLTMETNNNSQSGDIEEPEVERDDPPIVDFSLPITTTYLHHIRNKQLPPTRHGSNMSLDQDEDSMSSTSTSSHLSTESSPSPTIDTLTSPSQATLSHHQPTEGGRGAAEINGHTATSVVNLLQKEASLKQREGSLAEEVPSVALNMAERNGTYTDGADDTKPLNMSSAIRTEDKGHPERKRRASSDSLDSYQTKASESAADDISKDDEEENDDDDDDKLPGGIGRDPERLKAFNMFVRLFVDENLDRMVPISKQPKDKIQAILDACDRQFPEFHERSRKRIRTYLKSCRRMRRSKDTNGYDQLRPTPPHLTSAAAEGILAQACENESNNAKRMRMGLDPLPVNTTQTTALSSPAISLTQQTTSANTNSSHSPSQTTVTAPLVASLNHSPSHPPTLEKQSTAVNDLVRRTPSAPTAFRPPHELPSPFFTNSNGIFRPGFPNSYQSPAHVHPPVIQHTPLASQLQNGPTDLSMKKSSLTSPSTKSQLNSTEVATIKQLIAGYRESAAFLYRSADELEQLLLHQN